jgi:hypothetical protein
MWRCPDDANDFPDKPFLLTTGEIELRLTYQVKAPKSSRAIPTNGWIRLFAQVLVRLNLDLFTGS